jgi:hypothetical protein
MCSGMYCEEKQEGLFTQADMLRLGFNKMINQTLCFEEEDEDCCDEDCDCDESEDEEF